MAESCSACGAVLKRCLRCDELLPADRSSRSKTAASGLVAGVVGGRRPCAMTRSGSSNGAVQPAIPGEAGGERARAAQRAGWSRGAVGAPRGSAACLSLRLPGCWPRATTGACSTSGCGRGSASCWLASSGGPRTHVQALGRRSGKTLMAALVASHSVLFRPDLDAMVRPSETRFAGVLATNLAQARLLIRHGASHDRELAATRAATHQRHR
jgi:hypothetical protein